MSFQTIPNTAIEYGLIAFDDAGQERTDDIAGGTFSRTLLERIERDKPTNIFLFSHGWKGDADAANNLPAPVASSEQKRSLRHERRIPRRPGPKQRSRTPAPQPFPDGPLERTTFA